MDIEVLKSKKDLTLDEINKIMDIEKNTKVLKKLYYHKFKIMGYSKLESAKLAGFNDSNIYYLEDLWEEGGYNALVPHYCGGRNPKLSKKQINDLKKILKTNDGWLVNDVKNIIEIQFGVKYTYQNTKNLLNKLNIPILNYFELKKESEKNSQNTIENYNNLSDEDKNEINEIINTMNNEKSLYVYKKLLYQLFRKIGFNNNQSSEFLHVTSVTGNNWNNSWNNEGYEGLLRKKGQGRKRKMNSKQEKELKKKTK